MSFTFRESDIPLDLDSMSNNPCRALQFHSEIDEDNLPRIININNPNPDEDSDYLKIYLRIRPGPVSNRYQISDGRNLEVVTSDPGCNTNTNGSGYGSGVMFGSRSFNRETRLRFFKFNRIFQESTQAEVFETCGLPLVCNVLRGVNSLLFTYGVTSSGKTYTMRGTPHQPGLVPYAIASLFAPIKDRFQLVKHPVYKVAHTFGDSYSLDEEDQKREDDRRTVITSKAIEKFEDEISEFNKFELDFSENYQSTVEQLKQTFGQVLCEESEESNNDSDLSIWICYYEIYNEQIFDLLDLPELGPKQKLEPLIQGGVKNISHVFVTSASEAFMVYLWGQKNLAQHVARTNLNSASSRSHSIFQISLIRTDLRNQCRVTSNLAFCDLAGSERAKKTQSSGGQIREASQINKSLMHLRQCIQKESSKVRGERQMDHYRDSKLTMVLRPYLTGNEGQTCIIANLNPSDQLFDESFHSLQFCSIAATVEQSRVNEPKNIRRLTVHEEEDEEELEEEEIPEEDGEEIEELRETIQQRDEIIAKLRSRLRAKDEELKEVRSGYEKMIQSIEADHQEELATKEAEMNEEIQLLKEKTSGSSNVNNNNNNEANFRLGRNSEKEESLEKELFQANTRVAELETALELAHKERAEAFKLRAEVELERDEALKKQQISTESELSVGNEKLERLEKELFQANSRVAELETALELAEKERDEAKKVREESFLLKLNNDEKQERIEKLTEEIEASLKVKIGELEKQVELLTEQDRESKARLESLNSEKSIFESLVVGLRLDKKNLSAELESLRAKVLELEKSLNEKNCQEVEFEKTKSNLESEISTKSNQIAELEQRISDLVTESKRLEAEVENAKTRVELKEKTMKMQKVRLESEIKSLEEKVQSLERWKEETSDAQAQTIERLRREIEESHLESKGKKKTTYFHDLSDRSLENVDPTTRSNSPMIRTVKGGVKRKVQRLGSLPDDDSDQDYEPPSSKPARGKGKKVTHFHDLSDRSLDDDDDNGANENVDPKSPTPKKKCGGRKKALENALPKSVLDSLSKRRVGESSVLKQKQYSVKKTMPKGNQSLEMFSPETFMRQEGVTGKGGYNTRQRSRRQLF